MILSSLPASSQGGIWTRSSRLHVWANGQGRGWIGVCKSSNPLWFIYQICPSSFALKTQSWQNIWIKHQVWNLAQTMDESANRCNCRIRKSVTISLWIRNPGKNIFKIRRSVCLYTPLINALAAQSYLLQVLVYIKAGIEIHYIRYLSIWLWLFKSWIALSTE